MSYCETTTLVKRLSEGRREAKPLPCRAWSCPRCQPNRVKRLIAEGLGGRPNTFLTLTLRSNYPGSPGDRAKALTRAWRLIRLRWMREAKISKLPFLSVMEATAAGTPHLHILLRSEYFDQKYLSEWASEIIQSPIIWIERIYNRKKAASYVAKYCGKCPHKFENCKRYYKSRDYETDSKWTKPREKTLNDDCWLSLSGILSWIHSWQNDGYTVIEQKSGWWLATPPGGEKGF